MSNLLVQRTEASLHHLNMEPTSQVITNPAFESAAPKAPVRCSRCNVKIQHCMCDVRRDSMPTNQITFVKGKSNKQQNAHGLQETNGKVASTATRCICNPLPPLFAATKGVEKVFEGSEKCIHMIAKIHFSLSKWENILLGKSIGIIKEEARTRSFDAVAANTSRTR